ncbi:MAG: hypothetical protein KQJ78_07545 [Deltaproteobacteria bacterium]|nr:hypothetical protein [Deltaproteobacteria bacterium]
MQTLTPSQLNPEDDFLRRIVARNPGREIRAPRGPRWGHLILPAPGERPATPGQGLRVLAICSWVMGLLAFEPIKALARREPERLHLVGLVTDDPLDPAARISVKKRFWRYYDQDQQEDYELGMVESALRFGVPCYTGEVKCDYFRDKLAAWDPEVIVVSALGQAVDRPIINYPAFGIYNIHPSDLLHQHGAGPHPWEDMVERQAETTRVTLHRVSETIDGGEIVGQSPLINVRLADGGCSDDVRLLGEKSLLPVAGMVEELIRRVVAKKEAGQTGAIASIDFAQVFAQAFKDKLLEPIDPARRGGLLPLPEEDRDYKV